jgi:hypothetical protein
MAEKNTRTYRPVTDPTDPRVAWPLRYKAIWNEAEKRGELGRKIQGGAYNVSPLEDPVTDTRLPAYSTRTADPKNEEATALRGQPPEPFDNSLYAEMARRNSRKLDYRRDVQSSPEYEFLSNPPEEGQGVLGEQLGARQAYMYGDENDGIRAKQTLDAKKRSIVEKESERMARINKIKSKILKK